MGSTGEEQIGKLGLPGFRNIQVEGESDKGLQNHEEQRDGLLYRTEMDCSLSSRRSVTPKETHTS